MHCPTLTDLPAAPAGRAGWPWTEASPRLPEALPGGQPWPLISVVTPSYGQAQFVEAAIRSVLLQGYPALEYLVIDGGSGDGSVDIIRKYADGLAGWVSEPDHGQAHAVNKGWQRAHGRILGWLNSDDFYLPGALAAVAQAWEQTPEAAAVFGDGRVVDPAGQPTSTKKAAGFDRQGLLAGRALPQPALFVRGDVPAKIGYLNEALHYALDWEFNLRLFWSFPPEQIVYLPRELAGLRDHQQTKSRESADRFSVDRRAALQELAGRGVLPARGSPAMRRAWAATYWLESALRVRSRRYAPALLSFIQGARLDPASVPFQLKKAFWHEINNERPLADAHWGKSG